MDLRKQFEKETRLSVVIGDVKGQDLYHTKYTEWLEKKLKQSPGRVSVDAFVNGLSGEVIKIGEMYVDDELLTGMVVEITREEFLEQDTNFLYQKVKVTKEEAH
jgi:hypothetical protein